MTACQIRTVMNARVARAQARARRAARRRMALAALRENWRALAMAGLAFAVVSGLMALVYVAIFFGVYLGLQPPAPARSLLLPPFFRTSPGPLQTQQERAGT